MTSSVYLRLAGPLQSWAKPTVSGNYVHTNDVPTPSALRGLVAGALGCERDRWPEWLGGIEFTVREDRAARVVDEFHTIGSRENEWEFRRRLALAQNLSARSVYALAFKPGRNDRGIRSATVITRRTYLADAEFLVRVTCEGHTEELDQHLASPEFATYLGRKAFTPAFPFYLGVGNSELLGQIPALRPGAEDGGKALVRLYHLALGEGARPAQIAVPAAENRERWFAGVEGLGLRRRATV